MHLRIALALFLLASPVNAALSTFYLGTYTGASHSQGIYVGTLDTETGKLGPLRVAAVEKNPNFLALSSNHRFLYSALDEAVAAYKVQKDGTVRVLNQRPAQGKETAHISLDASGKTLFVANYGSATVASFALGADGSVGPAVSVETLSGAVSHGPRQDKPYAHCVDVDPQNRFLYACDLGTDNVWIYRLGAGGALTPAQPPAAAVPACGGPRHLAFSRDGKFVYVVDELSVATSVFARDENSGALTLLETISNLWPGVSLAGVTASEISLHPNGKWLYVSNRGHDTLSVFAIDAQGRLKLIESAPALVRTPRSFALDPTGRWMITAGQDDNRIAVQKVDPATGKLSATHESATVGSPVCVLFVPDPLLTILR